MITITAYPDEIEMVTYKAITTSPYDDARLYVNYWGRNGTDMTWDGMDHQVNMQERDPSTGEVVRSHSVLHEYEEGHICIVDIPEELQQVVGNEIWVGINGVHRETGKTYQTQWLKIGAVEEGYIPANYHPY